MKIFNKKGMTLLEFMVVVLLIAGMASIAYPSYLSSVEKAKVSEAVKLVAHTMTSAQQYYEENDRYPNNFNDLDFQITGKDVSINGAVATTQNFNIKISPEGDADCGTNEICAFRCKNLESGNCKYKYIIKGNLSTGALSCVTGGSSNDKKICASLGKLASEASNIYAID